MFNLLDRLFRRSNTSGTRADPRPPPASSRKKLLLFIHGLGGGPDDAGSARYWGEFARLARADPDLAQIYDIGFFSYPSTKFAGFPSTPVPKSAEKLHERLNAEWRSYDTVDIVAHSQGGLVARRYIADRVKGKQITRIGRAIFYDTPNMGSALGKGTELPGLGRAVSQEVLDLAPGSAMLQALLRDEEDSRSYLVVPIRFVVAGRPGIVDRPSAWGIGHPADYIVLDGHNHGTIIAPKDARDPIFVAAKSWLLDPTVRSGDDPAAISDQPLFAGKQFMDMRGEDGDRNRFAYWLRTIQFKGRDAEEAQLLAFLDDPSRRFSWMLLAGVGGIGKSRLALEIVLRARRDHWRAGFLDDLRSGDYWARWQPSRPTLLVIDYATQNSPLVGDILRGLAERPDGNALRRPVRLLLIVRDPKDARIETMLASVRQTAGGDPRRSDLVLAPMNVRHIFAAALTDSADIDAADAALSAIDPGSRRPLFAHLIADALARGENVRGWDRGALLNDLLARWRDRFWWPKASSLGLNERGFLAARTTLALATIINGLPLRAYPDHGDDLLPGWDAGTHSQLYEDMTGRPVETAIPALEPDIIGEFFALDELSGLAKLRQACGSTMAEALVDRAWALDGWHTAGFFDRVHQDFPQHELARAFVLGPPAAASAHVPWSALAVNLTAHLGPDPATRPQAIALYHELKALAADHPGETEIRALQATAAVNLTLNLGADPATRPQAIALYHELKALAAHHPGEKAIRALQATAAVNLTNHLGPDPATRPEAIALYHELKALAADHPGETEIRALQAKAASNLTRHLGADPATRPQAIALYHEFKALAAHHPGENEIREPQARAAVNLTAYLGADPATRPQAIALYHELKALAADHPGEKAIREFQAKAAVNLTSHLGADPATRPQAIALYHELKALAADHPGEKEIREFQAKAAVNLTAYLGADPATRPQAIALYHELKTLAAEHPSEKEIRLEQAKAAVNLTNHLGADPATRPQAIALYHELKTLAADHPSEKEIRERQAKAAVNLTNHLGADPATRPQAIALYDELKALAADHPGEKEIRLEQARAAFNLTLDLGADPATRPQAIALYHEIEALADDHPDETEIRALQAKAAIILGV